MVIQSGPPPPESNVAQLPLNDKPSFEEAMARSDAPKWKIAMLDQLRSIDENDVWETHPPPHHQKVLGCRWVPVVRGR
jgi:hypothetical protein